ncbi:MAG: hypothetical protein II820_05905 [Ruminiclostridium sp.]|nr:hypothetical protein [Ruminiclostridium sp.]
MAEKKQKKEDRSAAGYYNLKTDAVDRLVDTKNAPEVSDEEIGKYTSKKKFHIPMWLKILFVKFWFAGAVCYFFLWGLGMYLRGIDLMVVLAVGLGVVTDLMVNRALRHFEREQGENDKWIMVTVRKFWSIFLNVLYAGVLLYCVFRTYYSINMMLGVNAGADASEEVAMLGVEPILFGLFYLGFDMLFILAKRTIVSVFRDAAAKTSGGGKQKENQ